MKYIITAILSIVVFFCIFPLFSAKAETVVNKNIETNTVWALSGSPYRVMGKIKVNSGKVLEIKPGVEVNFSFGMSLTVGGTLKAIGAPEQRIKFTSSKSEPAAQDWQGLIFLDSSVDAQVDANNNYINGSIISYADIEYSGGFNYGGAVYIDKASPFIANNNITNNKAFTGAGIYVNEGSPIILNNYLSYNNADGKGGAIYAYKSSLLIRGNTISNNRARGQGAEYGGGGIYIDNKYGGEARIINNHLESNTASHGGGIYIFSFRESYGGLEISYNNFIDNSEYELYGFYGDAINAKNNYWNTGEAAEIDEKIYDSNDTTSFSKVIYDPFELDYITLVDVDSGNDDIVAPYPPTINETVASTTDVSVGLSGTKEENTSVWAGEDEIIELDESNTWSYEFSLEIGVNDISVTTKDSAGNESDSASIRIERFPVPCTNWLYSDWGVCGEDGYSRREVLIAYPEDCGQIDFELERSCDAVLPDCIEVTYSDWGGCVDGIEERVVESTSPENCRNEGEVLTRECEPPVAEDINSADEGGEDTETSETSEENTDELPSEEDTTKEEEIPFDNAMGRKLAGKILLQVEENGEGWYVNPADVKKYYLGRPKDAFNIMQTLGVGINNSDLSKIPIAPLNFNGNDIDGDGLSDMIEDSIGTDKNISDTDGDGYDDKSELINAYNPLGNGKLSYIPEFSNAQKGKILLQVEAHGEAWYINPEDAKRYFLGRPDDAFNLMRSLGLGITNIDIDKIVVGGSNDETDGSNEDQENTGEGDVEDDVVDESSGEDGNSIETEEFDIGTSTDGDVGSDGGENNDDSTPDEGEETSMDMSTSTEDIEGDEESGVDMGTGTEETEEDGEGDTGTGTNTEEIVPEAYDDDQDGLTNDAEIGYGTSPYLPDTDDDGLSDYDEIMVYNTEPLNPDTDGDGYLDGDEVANGFNPNGS